MQTYDAHARRVRLIALALATVAFLGLIGWGTQLVRTQMLENAQALGTKLARSYADREQARLGIYEMFLGYGASGLNDQIDNGADEQTTQRFLARFASGINTALGNATADPYVVIGGRISANTTRLAEISAARCPRTHHVEGADELRPEWFEGAEVIGITAGASTPASQIEAVRAEIARMVGE